MDTHKTGVRLLAGAVLAVLACGPAVAQEKEEGKKGGTVVGVVTSKGPNFVEVKAAGEEQPRKYVPHWRGGQPAQGGGLDKQMLAKIRAVKVGSRVRLKWEFEERARVVELEILKGPDAEQGGKKDGGRGSREGGDQGGAKEEARKTGTVVGVLTAKGDNFVEVKGAGEEQPRKYYLHFGGTRELLAAMRETPVGTRVRVEWTFVERPRVLAMQPLNTGDGGAK